MRQLRIVALLAVASSCVTTTHNVNIGQVNRPSVPFTSAAPTSGVASLTAGVSSLPAVTTRSTSDISGAEIPKAQGRAELTFRPRRDFFLGAVYEAGFGHQAVTPGLPTTRSGNVRGLGMILGGTIGNSDSSRFSLGVNATLMSWTVPYDQFSTVVVDAGIISGVAQYMTSNRESANTMGLGLWPTWKLDQLRVFGGGYVTQRPTVHLFTTDTTGIDPDLRITHTEEDVVGNEAVDLVLAAGIEYTVSPEFTITAIINQEVLGAIMQTGPSLQLGASIRLGKHPADRPPTTAPYGAPPYGPPPYGPAPYGPPPTGPVPYGPPGTPPPPPPPGPALTE